MALKDFFQIFSRNPRLSGRRPVPDDLIVPSLLRHTVKLYPTTLNSHFQGVCLSVNEILRKSPNYIGVKILPLSTGVAEQLMIRASKGTRSFLVVFIYREELRSPVQVSGYLQVYLPEAANLEELVRKINEFADTNPVVEVAINLTESLEHGKPPTYWAEVLYYA